MSNPVEIMKSALKSTAAAYSPHGGPSPFRTIEEFRDWQAGALISAIEKEGYVFIGREPPMALARVMMEYYPKLDPNNMQEMVFNAATRYSEPG